MTIDENLVKEIERAHIAYFRGRNQVWPLVQGEQALLWHALERLVEDERPDFWEAVEIGGTVCLLVVTGGSASIISVEGDKAVTRHLGSLVAGSYTETISHGEEGYTLEGVFEHERLVEPMRIRADRWRDFDTVKGARDVFRRWASSEVRLSGV
jgi:hypothetical protein